MRTLYKNLDNIYNYGFNRHHLMGSYLQQFPGLANYFTLEGRVKLYAVVTGDLSSNHVAAREVTAIQLSHQEEQLFSVRNSNRIGDAIICRTVLKRKYQYLDQICREIRSLERQDASLAGLIKREWLPLIQQYLVEAEIRDLTEESVSRKERVRRILKTVYLISE